MQRKTKYESELGLKSVDERRTYGMDQVLLQRKAECERIGAIIRCGAKGNMIVSSGEANLAAAVNYCHWPSSTIMS